MISLFISYSHQDEELRNELEKHLAVLLREGIIDVWHDRRIIPGDDFEGKISAQLESANVVLLLLSADFLHSNYCYDIEMGRALERDAEGAARVIPVILRPCDWQHSPLGKLLATPTDGKPVIEHTSLDRGFMEVVNAVREAITATQPDRGACAQNSARSEPDDFHERSSNLRIKREFSDRDRHSFLENGFEYIANYFDSSLQELEARNSGVEGRLKRIDANSFEAVAYIDGAERSRCGIWLDSNSPAGGILFSYDGVGSGNSYNESISVSDNGHTLFFSPMGMPHYAQNRDEEFTREGVSEYCWSLFVEQLR